MRHCFAKGSQAFTLIELLATVVILAILVAITIGVAGYVQRRIAVGTAKSQIAAMSAALEMYKSDWGYYPASTKARFSGSGIKEGSNNLCLYRALTGLSGGKRYMNFPASAIRTNTQVWTAMGAVNYGLFDPWGTLYNYYCSPNAAFALSNNCYGTFPVGSGYSVGGQKNIASFDLFSCGPDKATFLAPMMYTGAPGTCGGNSILIFGSWSDGPWLDTGMSKTNSATDDITNWKQ